MCTHYRTVVLRSSEFVPVTEVDKLLHEEHMQLELGRITRCVSHLKGLVRQVSSVEHVG